MARTPRTTHAARRRTATIVALAAAIGLGAVAGARPVPAQEQLTFTVGVSQEIDSLNMSVGLLVVDYEVWNLQYAALVELSDEDFSAEPGLAEKWESSDDGLTWTYTLREGLQWSDGEPLTADDVVYSIERPRDEEWGTWYETVKNLEATAVDDRTIEVTSSVPDPKLPALGIYVLPEHVYEKVSADDLPSYKGEDPVGSGPFVLSEHKPGESWRMEKNPNWYGFEPYVDEIIFRYFAAPDQLLAALENGEVDAIDSVDEDLIDQTEKNDDLVVVEGSQGGFSHVGINTGDGLGDGHPALADRVVRQAINRAIDREVLVEEILAGRGTPGVTMAAAYSPLWEPEIPLDDQLTFDPDAANAMLDDAGYDDTDGDGIREMPDGSRPLEFRLHIRADSKADQEKAEFIVPWLNDIGIDTEVLVATEDELTAILGRGEFDMFTWGWVPFADPSGMLSSLICDQVTVVADEPLYNDANWCNEDYDRLYEQQNQELDHDRRVEQVHEMLRIHYDDAAYVVLFKYSDVMAHAKDWTGFVRQPAETGPELFNNSSHSYLSIRPDFVAARDGDPTGAAPTDTTVAEPASDDSGTSTGLIVGIGVGVLVLAGIVVMVMRGRGRGDERE